MSIILLKIMLLAVIGSIIGYVTNVIAIKLLFKPYKAIKIPFIGFSIQGLIPMRQNDIAKSIGDIVAIELISMDDILQGIVTEKKIRNLMIVIKDKVRTIIEKKIAEFPLLSGFKGMIIKYFDEMMDHEGEEQVRRLLEEHINHIKSEVNISQIVEEKINALDLGKIEELVYEIARKELRHIEVLGGVLGFMIGIVQGIVVQLF
ncbi:MAG: DUF445 family protein [Tissierellales bacterium]|jgi:uncharacterized membrane protein YheB (UPF0754 family)|nr:DUF445 family protein [Tissierellales bacterium]MBN2826727.1 DUF445 family protein [Tissierellales bacterium]